MWFIIGITVECVIALVHRNLPRILECGPLDIVDNGSSRDAHQAANHRGLEIDRVAELYREDCELHVCEARRSEHKRFHPEASKRKKRDTKHRRL